MNTDVQKNNKQKMSHQLSEEQKREEKRKQRRLKQQQQETDEVYDLCDLFENQTRYTEENFTNVVNEITSLLVKFGIDVMKEMLNNKCIQRKHKNHMILIPIYLI